MGIGLGVVLVVIGAILLWAIEVDLNFVDDSTLGVIFLVGGVVTIALSLIVTAQHRRTTHVEERRYEQP